MWVVLAVFPHSEMPKINIISIPEPPTMTHSFLGDGRRREKVPARLFWTLHWRGGFPCLAWMTALPHKTWKLLTPTLGRVCLCLFVIYWCLRLAAWSCVFACRAADLPAQDVGVFACYICRQVVFYVCVYLLYLNAYCIYVPCVHARLSHASCDILIHCSKSPVQLSCSSSSSSSSPVSDDFQKLPLFTQSQWHVCPPSSKHKHHSDSAELICHLSHFSVEKQSQHLDWNIVQLTVSHANSPVSFALISPKVGNCE